MGSMAACMVMRVGAGKHACMVGVEWRVANAHTGIEHAGLGWLQLRRGEARGVWHTYPLLRMLSTALGSVYAD